MTDLGKAKQFLGLEIERHDSGAISLRQTEQSSNALEWATQILPPLFLLLR